MKKKTRKTTRKQSKETVFDKIDTVIKIGATLAMVASSLKRDFLK